MTSHNGYRSIEIRTSAASGVLSGYFILYFQDQSFSFPAYYSSWSAKECQRALEALPNIKKVNCTMLNYDSVHGGATYLIQLKKFPTLPYENNIYTHDGNPPIKDFYCNTRLVNSTMAHGISCNISNYNVTYTLPGRSCFVSILSPFFELIFSFSIEYDICSNRGVCDFSTGVCSCFTGFTNSNCDSYTKLLRSSSRAFSSNVLRLSTANELFSANVVNINSEEEATSDYSVIAALDSTKTVFNMDGKGNMNLSYGGLKIFGKNISHEAQFATGGETIYTGGLSIIGGLSIGANGLNVTTDSFTLDGGLSLEGGLALKNGGITIIDSVGVSVLGGVSIQTSGLSVIFGGLRAYAGGATISGGGLAVTGGLTVAAGGARIFKRGMTINSGGLYVLSGGIQLKGSPSGLSITSYLYVNSDGVTATSGITVYDLGILVTGGVTIANEGLTTKYLRVQNNGLVSSGTTSVNTGGVTAPIGLTINSGGVASNGGMTVYSGLSIKSDGVLVTSGTMQILSGGLTTSSTAICNITVLNSNLSISGAFSVTNQKYPNTYYLKPTFQVLGGMIVKDSGLVVTGGLTIVDTGLYVNKKGTTVTAGGVRVTDGVTVSSSGVYVTGGITILSAGLKVSNGGLSVQSDGVYSVTGVTVLDAGVAVSGGVTVQSSGVRVSGGVTVQVNGMTMSGGLTVKLNGISVTGGLSVTSLGAYVSGGMTLHGGIAITNGLTIQDGGFKIFKNGLTISSAGMNVLNSIIVLSAGVAITKGLTILNQGIQITGGLSIKSGGAIMPSLEVFDRGLMTTKGLTIFSSGLAVTAGMTVTSGLYVDVMYPYATTSGLFIQSGGLYLVGGTSVKSSGLVVADGPTILSNGLSITNGLTILDGGLFIPIGDFTINSGSLYAPSLDLNTMFKFARITGGLEISGGLRISSGLSVHSGGVYLPDAVGLTVESGGLVVTAGVTVNSQALMVSGGVTIYANGLNVHGGGMTVFTGDVAISSITVDSGGVSVSNAAIVSNGASVTGNLNVFGGATLTELQTINQGMVVSGGMSVSYLGVHIRNQYDSDSIAIKSDGLVIDGDCTSDDKWVTYMIGSCVLFSGNKNYWENTPTIFSDKNLKTNITTLDTSLQKLKALRGVYFSWRDDPQDVRQVGLIAQDVLREIPEIVEVANPEGHLAVKYLEVLPLIVEAIKELNDSITAGEAKKQREESVRDPGGLMYSQEQMDNCPCSEDIMKEYRELVAAVEVYEKEERRLLDLLDLVEKSSFQLHM